MTAGHVAVDLVIQTASGILTGRFAPREAVTILASQVPRACGDVGLGPFRLSGGQRGRLAA
ncbi:MAG TPA: hypothetical protein VHF91_06570, partial [Acidimicrobiales bacterium]|nr:hypothetical protein [Acidimicrobiales bacterium]